MCDECRKPCQLLHVDQRPVASEWYCEACHKSYPVYKEGAKGQLVRA